MKSTQKLSISLLFCSALLSIACINATAQSTTPSQYQAAQAPTQTIRISAHALTTEEKITYDTEFFKLSRQPIPSVIITAKRLSSEEKLAVDKSRTRNLQANMEFNKMLRKTA